MFQRFLVPVYLPTWLHEPLRKAKRVLIPAAAENQINQVHPAVTILGERNVEWSFLSTEMPRGPGEALDFGCERGYLSLLAAQRGFHVVAVDLEDQPFLWAHPSVDFHKADLLELDLPERHFDLIINCSSVEHVGLVGRYGVNLEQRDGDIRMMERLAELLKPTGCLLMTVPCGRDSVLAPWNRVYGENRLPRILARFEVAREAYWVKNSSNQWVLAERREALDLEPRHDPVDAYNCLYALGCFVLRLRTSEKVNRC